MLDDILELFKPLENLVNEWSDKNYLIYALLGSFLLIIALVIYLIFFFGKNG